MAPDTHDVQHSHVAHDIEKVVIDRYARGAQQVEAALCCPIEGYEAKYLEAIPQEILEKDYGCGDPSRWAHEGDTVVDLGSGQGKICYILAQRVGAEGRVIGVDFNDTMLALARKYQDQVAQRIGYKNTTFVKGRIQDLALDLDQAAQWIANHPIRNMNDQMAYESECERLRRESPMVASDSVDLVVSNCVLNLVQPRQKKQLFAEIFRVLKRGGRAVISDIVCDEDPSPQILNDPKLWSGCVSGAFREDQFLEMFEEAGFHGVEILARTDAPWQTIDGIEFRSMTVRAYKGKQGPCLERHQTAIYQGPWKQVLDDDGHTYFRGKRMAVCDKTLQLLTDPKGPYAGQFIGIEPYQTIPLDDAQEYDCRRNAIRPARMTKGEHYHATKMLPGASNCCGPNTGCC